MNFVTYQVRVYESGTKKWYLNNKLHREDGPAAEYTNGSKFWYFNGELHREDGPAVILPNGSPYWYVLGVTVEPFTPEQYPLVLLQVLDV